MKRIHSVLVTLLSVGLILTSCSSSDDNNYTYTDQCYLGSFTLGQMKRTMHAKNSKGEDSTYVTAFSGMLYKMLIDQRAQTITNRDSLPMGTNLNAVLATITGTGGICYATSPDASEWTDYSSKDSIDFSQPLYFRVYANDGKSYRDYYVKVNVQQYDPNSFTWVRLADVRPSGKTDVECRLFFKDDGVPMLLSLDANGKVFTSRGSSYINPTWTETECVGLPSAPEVHYTQYFNDRYWMLASQKLYVSDDAISWQEVTPTDGTILLRLVASSFEGLYASVERMDVATGTKTATMARSTDGKTWSFFEMETGGFTGYPAAGLYYWQANGNERVLLADNAFGGTAPLTIWSLLEDYENSWMLFAQQGDNNFLLPAQQQLNILSYDDKLIALGGAFIGGDASSTLTKAYISYDNGITWKSDNELVPPTNVQGTTGAVAAASAGDCVWLVAGGQVWQARMIGLDD